VPAALAAWLIAAAAAADELLVLEKGTNTLAIIDPRSLQVRARVAAGPDPHEVVATSDGTRAYISNYGGEGSSLNTLSVVDVSGRRPLAAIDLGALHSPHGLDFAGGKVYFTAESNKVIGRFDPATSHIDWVMGTGQDRTHMVLVARDLQHIYTTNVRSGTVSFIESSSRRAFGPPPQTTVTVWDQTVIPAGRGSEGFDVSPSRRELWVANSQDQSVTVIDVAAKKAVQTFAIPGHGANRLKFTTDGRYALISALGTFGSGVRDHDNLIVVDVRSHQPVKTLDLGGGAAGILLSPDAKRAFVAVSQGDRVAVIDLQSLAVSGEVSPLRQPDGMAWASRP
jgi:DNA-binding beta-propeller fold protein YncE